MAKAKRSELKSDEVAYLEDLKRKVTSAMDLLDDSKIKAQIAQDYYDGIQWTTDERNTLNKRGQPVLTFNHIKPAINAIIGLVERGKTDPKAWGRTPKDSDAAEVATDGLRYVADVNRFQTMRREALKDMLVWGTAVAVVEVDGEKEVTMRRVRPEEYFYDPYSREADFSDARYDGIAKWMDEADAVAMFPDKEAIIRQSVDTAPQLNESFKDRPNRAWSWADSKSRRIMLFEMYHRRGADWYRCVFVGGGILAAGLSEYKDSKGRPRKCTIAQSAFVDRDNCRYGVVRDMIGPQDAINKGRSKAVHILNVAKLRVDPGVMDVDAIRAEWAKPDGIIEARDGQIQELGDKQLTPSHMQLLADAKDEMRRQSPTPGLVGRGGSSQSGRAILAEQQAGMMEQSPVLASFDDWTMRMYRSMWECIKQFWDGPKWIRVTDDEQAPRFIMMNEPALMMGPDGNPVIGPDGQPVIDPNVPPRNSPAQMDVDIIIDSTPDTAVIQEEQFAKIAELVQAGVPIPPDVIIEASSLPKKRMLLDRLKKAQESQQGQPDPNAQAMQAEQAKLEMQMQAKREMMQLDAQAHSAQLDRDAKAQEMAAFRQANLENHKAALRERELNMQAEHAGRMKNMEYEHSSRQSEMSFEYKQREQAGNMKPAPQFGLTLGEQTEAAIAMAQEASASAMAQAADGMTQAAQAMQQTASAIASIAQVSAAPRRLVKDPRTGEKRVEIVREPVN